MNSERILFLAQFFTIVAILGVMYLIVCSKYSEFTSVKSSVDGKWYSVRKLPDRKVMEKAADTLANLSRKLSTLVEYVITSGGGEDGIRYRLSVKFDPGAISEASEYMSDGKLTSYTVNKGEKIGFCLKCRKCDSVEFEPDNTLVFVGIHELAHIANDEEGHGQKFQKINKFLLDKAIECGVWTFKDYTSQPVKYCGTIIDGLPS
jgi:hypothetical protein